ncbi:MAG: hypothetical protein M3R13_12035 [Armatimonadota bacterium]|nr:hypothetical protein [Armatimonadota bacterium]
MAEVLPGAVAPEEVAPAVDAAPAPDSTAEQGEIVEKPETPERTFTQKELDDIVQRRVAKESRRSERFGEERARREAAERELDRIRGERTQPQPVGDPQPKDFADYESWMRAMVKHEIAQGSKQAQTETQEQQRQRQAFDQAAYARSKLNGSDELEDFDDVVFAPDVPFSQAMAAAIVESDSPRKVAYHLATNKDEAHRIAQLPPTQQIREIAKLESKLSAPSTPTKTPAPIVPSGTKTTVTKEPSSMSDKEFADWRKRQIAQRR